MTEVPYDPDDRMPLYRVDMYPFDGGARGDTALVLINAVDDAPVARQVFSDAAMCGEPDPELDPLSVADWLRVVVTANFTKGRNVCDDCGNPYDGDLRHGGHAVDCDYADN